MHKPIVRENIPEEIPEKKPDLKVFVNESITKALGNLNASPLKELLKNMQQHLKKHEEKLVSFDEKMNQMTDDSFFEKLENEKKMLENEKKIQEENNFKQQEIFKGYMNEEITKNIGKSAKEFNVKILDVENSQKEQINKVNLNMKDMADNIRVKIEEDDAKLLKEVDNVRNKTFEKIKKVQFESGEQMDKLSSKVHADNKKNVDRLNEFDNKFKQIDLKFIQIDEKIVVIEETITQHEEKLTLHEEKLTAHEEKLTEHENKITKLEERCDIFENEFKQLKTLVEDMNEKLEELVKLNIGKRLDFLESSTKLNTNKISTLSKDFTNFKNDIKRDKDKSENSLNEFMQNVETKLCKIDTMPSFKDLQNLSNTVFEKCKLIDHHTKSLINLDNISKENSETIQSIEKKFGAFDKLKLNVKDYQDNNVKVNADFELIVKKLSDYIQTNVSEKEKMLKQFTSYDEYLKKVHEDVSK